MQRVMYVIIPLRIVKFSSALFRALKVARLVEFVFQNQVGAPVRLDRLPHFLGKLRKKVLRRIVKNRMDGVQPKSVETIFRQPVQGIVNEKVAHSTTLRPVEVDGLAPRRAVPIGKKLWRVGIEIISLRAEVIVDDI